MSIGMPFIISQSQSLGSIKGQQNVFKNKEGFSKFGDVFNKVVQSEEKMSSGIMETVEKEIQPLLKADSVEDIFDLLEIPNDEGLIILSQGEEEQVITIEELMSNIDDILTLLNMNTEQLNEIAQELLREEVRIDNIWDFIHLVNHEQQSLNANVESQLLDKMTSILFGEENGLQRDVVKFLQVIKLAQLVGEQSQLKLEQQEQISNLKTFLLNIEKTIIKEMTTSTGKFSLENFQQVVVKQVKTEVDSNAHTTSNISLHQNSETKTITITLPNTNNGSQAESLVKQIESILQRSQISNSQGTTKLLLKLYPEHLGSIRIELVQRDGVISARLLASTALGKELLDSQIHQLKQAFVQQNIQLDRIDIQQSLQETDLRDQNLFNNMFKGQQQSEENDKDSEEQQDDEKLSFKEFLVNEEV